MLQLTQRNDPALEQIPVQFLPVVQQALIDLNYIHKSPSNIKTRGCVLFIQPHDKPTDILPISAKPLSSLDGVYRQGRCLVGIILWGNSGEGVSIICPEAPDYACEIQRSLR
jgi:hypothetical protein